VCCATIRPPGSLRCSGVMSRKRRADDDPPSDSTRFDAASTVINDLAVSRQHLQSSARSVTESFKTMAHLKQVLEHSNITAACQLSTLAAESFSLRTLGASFHAIRAQEAAGLYSGACAPRTGDAVGSGSRADFVAKLQGVIPTPRGDLELAGLPHSAYEARSWPGMMMISPQPQGEVASGPPVLPSTAAVDVTSNATDSDSARGKRLIEEELKEALTASRHRQPTLLEQNAPKSYSQTLRTSLLELADHRTAEINERFAHLAPQSSASSSSPTTHGTASWMTNPDMLQQVQASRETATMPPALAMPPVNVAHAFQPLYAPDFLGMLLQQQIPLQLPSSVALCDPTFSVTPLGWPLSVPPHTLPQLAADFAAAPSMPTASAVQPREALTVPPGAPGSQSEASSLQATCAAADALLHMDAPVACQPEVCMPAAYRHTAQPKDPIT